MGRSEDLSKIERSIKDAETRLKTIQTNLFALDKEISNVSSLEKTWKENVACLKKQKIIAIAQEFKKAKEELKRIQNRIVILKNDQDRFKKALKDVDSFLKQAQKDHDKLKKMSDNNVLSFSFGKKNGQR